MRRYSYFERLPRRFVEFDDLGAPRMPACFTPKFERCETSVQRERLANRICPHDDVFGRDRTSIVKRYTTIIEFIACALQQGMETSRPTRRSKILAQPFRFPDELVGGFTKVVAVFRSSVLI